MARPRKGDYWAKIINGMTGPFPEVGADPPILESTTIEATEVTKEVKTSSEINPEAVGNLSRVTMDLYFFMDSETSKYFLMQNQIMRDLGEMTLEEAAEIVKKHKRRR